MVNLRARWPDFLQRSFSGETLYLLNILQIFCVLFPTSDITEGTQSRNLFYILSHVYEKPHPLIRCKIIVVNFLMWFELSFFTFYYLHWVHFNFLTLLLYFNRGGKMVSHQSQHNLYYLSEVLATFFGLTLIVLMWRIGWAHNNARK